MAEVLLTHAVNEAEEAIETGNYGGAIAACQRILGQFPEFAGAHRIMAEAYAEQGDLESAREAYQRTLERDPQSIPAHLGLGMMAEDAGDRESSLAYYQVAWEIDPRRRDLREHVSRVSQQLYGSDGRLYLTRAALASLHFHAGRWDRAVSEAAQVLQEYSSRIDVQVRLAEALWRRGDDEQARQLCRTILRSLPSAVVPLLVLADIHRHEGDDTTARDLLNQARNIDPDGVRAADLIMIGLDDQADFLAVDSIPVIDDQIVHEEPARYAPAPDFMSSEPEAGTSVDQPWEDVEVPLEESGTPGEAPVETSEVQPFRWDDISDEDLEVSDLDTPPDDPGFSLDPSEFSLPTDEEIEQARPSDQRPTGFTSMLESLDSEGVQPFDFGDGTESSEVSESAHDDVLDDASLPTDEDLERARPGEQPERGYTEMLDSLDSEGMEPFDPTGGASGDPVESPVEDVPADSGIEETALPTDEELERARPGEDPVRGHTGMFDSLDAEGMEPFDPFGGVSDADSDVTPSEAAPPQDDDFLSDLTLPSDEDLEQARPGDEQPQGFTGMLSSLDAEGMEPFDPFSGSDSSDEDAVEPEAASEQEPAVEQPEPQADEPFDLDWSRIDEEIEDAIPGEMPSGYTDELRDLDDFGLEPFSFSESGATAGDVSDEASPGDLDAAPVPGAGEDDEMDLDELTAGWDLEGAEESTDIAEDEPETVDVLFAGEEREEVAGTEPLRSEVLDDFEADADESGGDDPLVDPAELGWALDEGFDQLIAEVEAASADWPLSGSDAPSEDVDLFAETVNEIQHLSQDRSVPEESSSRPGTSRLTASSITAERLGLDEALIDRARASKQSLINQGLITGSVPLPGSAVSLESLRSAVEADPMHIDSRISLASELVNEFPDEALEQFRWVYRNAPDRGPEVMADLVRLIVVMREREVGVHRLLGALYRRHGDWLAAATHYEESLTGKRRGSIS